MGSPVSPIIANLFMEDFEKRALTSARVPPKRWDRYVDDTFCIMKRILVDEFTQHINSQNQHIKFTVERESNGMLPMLDAKIMRREDGSLKVSVYRKPTHTDQYLSFGSHQPLQHKLGVIRTLTHRADTIITEPQDKEEEKDNIKKALKKCGYPEWAFTVASIKKDKNLRKEDSAEGNNKRKRPSVTLPYVQGTSEALRRILTKHGVQVHLKPYNTLRQFLVNPKDPKPKEDMAGAIYYIPCGECDASYVGKTERPFKKRLQNISAQVTKVVLW